MTDPPRVAVIVPVYDGERFLAACLESILAQDHEPLEVIVVDDGSTDGSAAIAEAHQGVRVLRRPHEGLHATRNAGVAAASTTDLIGWCDSDDTWKPGKLRLQVDHLQAHAGCDIVLTRMDHAFEDGVEPPPWLRRDQRFDDLDGVSMASGLYRRHVFERVGGFRSQTGGDFDLLIRARTAGCGIDVLDEVLWTRRIHDRNMMTTSNDADVGAAALMPSVRAHMQARRRR